MSVGTLVSVEHLEPRQWAAVRGKITSVQVSPADAPPVLIATVDDGTGTVQATFLGRRLMAALVPGIVVTMEGRVADAHGGLQMFNPRYHLS